ncbi:hypothetical protein N7526_003992 [Penicillium atrosanguineum]|nr:hypothetical protein N7526_003992 [Penicillium atrosanguineum]
MTAPERESQGLIRREAALNARDAITHQYATSTKKETKTPSTKKFPDPISRYMTAQFNKRSTILLSSDDEDQPSRKRMAPSLSANNIPQHTSRVETVSQADFNALRSLVTRLLHESRADRATNQELESEIASLKEVVAAMATLLEAYESVIDKTQIKALEAQLLSERTEARLTRLEVPHREDVCMECAIRSCEDEEVVLTDNLMGSYDCNMHDTLVLEAMVLIGSPSSTQPDVELQNPSFTPDASTGMPRPVNYETADERPSPKRLRTSSFDTPSGSSVLSQSNQSSPRKSSPVKPTPIKQEKPQPQSPSSVRNKPARFIKLTPTQATSPSQVEVTPRAEVETVKLRAELSQLRLDFGIEKQRNEALRSQFEVERCLNEFLRGQTIAEQNVNKSLQEKVTALEQRLDRHEPTFVTLQHLKQVLLTWLRDYLVQARTEAGGSSQQVVNPQL